MIRGIWKICAPRKYTDVPVQLTKRPENQEHGEVEVKAYTALADVISP